MPFWISKNPDYLASTTVFFRKSYDDADELADAVIHCMKSLPKNETHFEDLSDNLAYRFRLDFKKVDNIRPLANLKALLAHNITSDSIEENRKLVPYDPSRESREYTNSGFTASIEMIDHARFFLELSESLKR